MQNHRTMKYMYRTYWRRYILRSLFESNETNIQGMTFLHQLFFETQDSQWTVKCRSHWLTYILGYS